MRSTKINSGGNIFSVPARNGYNAGYRQGTEDGRHAAGFGYRDDEIYQAATEGYDPSMGGRSQYQSLFHQAYARGYSDGYNGRPRTSDLDRGYSHGDQHDRAPRELSRSDILGLAFAKGYHNGFEHGVSDKPAGRSLAYRHDELSEQAMTGYDRSWNMQGDYQNAFRRGYVRGFSDGYAGR